MPGVSGLQLAWGLAVRDLRSRYQDSLLGALWSLVSPLLLIGIYAAFFGRVLGIRAEPGEPPFVLHLFAGYLVWDLFGRMAGEGADVLLGSRAILTKVRLPLATVFFARMLYHLIHWAFATLALLAVMLLSGLRPGLPILALPLFVLLLCLFTLGVTMLLAVLGLFLRDLREVFAVLLTAWLLATPIFYYAERMPALGEGWLGALYRANPLLWFVEGFRGAVLHARWPAPSELLLLATVAALVYAAGFAFLRRSRRLVLDVL
jgi:ABC-type polysaccharide/polyol phosphate export permease